MDSRDQLQHKLMEFAEKVQQVMQYRHPDDCNYLTTIKQGLADIYLITQRHGETEARYNAFKRDGALNTMLYPEFWGKSLSDCLVDKGYLEMLQDCFRDAIKDRDIKSMLIGNSEINPAYRRAFPANLMPMAKKAAFPLDNGTTPEFDAAIARVECEIRDRDFEGGRTKSELTDELEQNIRKIVAKSMEVTFERAMAKIKGVMDERQKAGDFGAVSAITLPFGDKVVVRSHSAMETKIAITPAGASRHGGNDDRIVITKHASEDGIEYWGEVTNKNPKSIKYPITVPFGESSDARFIVDNYVQAYNLVQFCRDMEERMNDLTIETPIDRPTVRDGLGSSGPGGEQVGGSIGGTVGGRTQMG